jgi:hypothetical protein
MVSQICLLFFWHSCKQCPQSRLVPDIGKKVSRCCRAAVPQQVIYKPGPALLHSEHQQPALLLSSLQTEAAALQIGLRPPGLTAWH